MEVRFDWTISFGTMLHLTGMLAGGIVLYMKMVQRMRITEMQVRRLYIWTRELIKNTPGVDPTVIATINNDGD